MTDFLDEYALRFRAAAEAEAARRRPRVPVRAIATAVVVAGALAALASGIEGGNRAAPDEIEQPPATAPAGYADQRALLGVLREPEERDAHPQVRATLRDYARLRPRTGRLLGFAPSGRAYVLLATRHYESFTVRDGVPITRRRPHGVCLVRRGSEGGEGTCAGTADIRAGRLRGALAGQAYGVVPDGVASVLPAGRSEPVPVRRNFYVYPVRGSVRPPAWLDANGKEVRRDPPLAPPLPFLGRTGTASVNDYRGHVVVVGFWASWCDPCRAHLRELQAVQERVGGKVAVFGAATKDLAKNARAALERDRIRIPVFHDPEGRLAATYGIRAFPHTLVLASDGRVVRSRPGPVRAPQVEAWVQAARRR